MAVLVLLLFSVIDGRLCALSFLAPLVCLIPLVPLVCLDLVRPLGAFCPVSWFSVFGGCSPIGPCT